MKITVAQINYHVGNFEANVEKMLQAVKEAKAAGSDIVCFSEHRNLSSGGEWYRYRSRITYT